MQIEYKHRKIGKNLALSVPDIMNRRRGNKAQIPAFLQYTKKLER